mmetsp:Transcript_10827/g.25733  ORF Transcript_10827/g.25733 Transcript_10827/m.25733 type:complete len:221 (-) Transcript_10827:325-987(-)
MTTSSSGAHVIGRPPRSSPGANSTSPRLRPRAGFACRASSLIHARAASLSGSPPSQATAAEVPLKACAGMSCGFPGGAFATSSTAPSAALSSLSRASAEASVGRTARTRPPPCRSASSRPSAPSSFGATSSTAFCAEALLEEPPMTVLTKAAGASSCAESLLRILRGCVTTADATSGILGGGLKVVTVLTKRPKSHCERPSAARIRKLPRFCGLKRNLEN